MARYRVVGRHAVAGHQPGGEFDHEFDPTQERRLIAGGHIAPVLSRRSKPAPDDEVDGDTPQEKEQ